MLLSFPFLVLRIPGLKLIITHAQRTGYNRQGVCVGFTKTKLPFSARSDIMSAWSCEDDEHLREEVDVSVAALEKRLNRKVAWGNHRKDHPDDLIDWRRLENMNRSRVRTADDLRRRAKLLFEGDFSYRDGAERVTSNQKQWSHEDDKKLREVVKFCKLDNWRSLNNASTPTLTEAEKQRLNEAENELSQIHERYKTKKATYIEQRKAEKKFQKEQKYISKRNNKFMQENPLIP